MRSEVARSRRAASRPASRPSLLVVHPGAELYGADRVLVESAEALADSFEITVVLPGPGPLVAELERRGLRVVLCRMPVLRNAAMRPRGALRLVADAILGAPRAFRLLRRHGAAGVYVNTLTLPWWPLLARVARRPSVCHVHEAEQSARRILRRGMAICPALSDRVIANSRFSLDVLTETVPSLRRRSTVIHNAVRGPAKVTPPRADLAGPLQLVFVGRLSPRKGPDVAVATLRELVERGVDARLALLGSVFEGYGWFEAGLRRSVEDWGLSDRVDFLGFQSDVWPHLGRADIALVPSVAEESFGNTAVEALLAARPLVVSDTSGLREATAGYEGVQAVAPGQPSEWADAVQSVVTGWDSYRVAACRDAVAAGQRHAPELFRESLVSVVSSLCGQGDPDPAEALGEPAPAG